MSPRRRERAFLVMEIVLTAVGVIVFIIWIWFMLFAAWPWFIQEMVSR